MAGVNSEDRLQQYFDGELSGAEADAVRLELERSEELRAKLEGLRRLQVLVREHEPEEPVDGDALWSAIQAKLAAASDDDEPMFPTAVRPEPTPGLAPTPGLKVIDGGKTERPSVPDAVRRARQRRGMWLGAAGTITAAAAAVMLFVARPGLFTGGTEVGGPPPGSEVEEVDFGYSTGAIFSVEGNEGARYAVVWISDEKPFVDEDGSP